MPLARLRAHGHAFHDAPTLISTRLETLVTRALVRCHALPVLAPVLAIWHTTVLLRRDETLPTSAHVGRYAGTVATKRAHGFAPIVRILREPVIASANIGLGARGVDAIWLANRFTGRDDRRVVQHLRPFERFYFD